MKNKTVVVSEKGEPAARAEEGSKGIVKLGLDLHYRQVTVAMQEEGAAIKGVGKFSHDRFGAWIERKLKAGWEIHSCYEAGASGYWLHRDLVELGVKNLVVAPKAMGRDKRQKTDRRDSAELAESLDRYLRSKDKRALCPVAVPTLQQEQDRALVRFHRQLMADRNRYEARGKPQA
jgi:transposase